MNTTKTTAMTDNDTKRRAFSPIQIDLLERLAQEAETRTGGNPSVVTDRASTKGRLAA
jgi:hypothetical protein